MKFNPTAYHYASRRNVVYASNGMVATSVPQAAQAGLEMLKRGGNAIDAAVAAAACLTVVEPTSNGIGSDAFALVWSNGKLHGLNSSGPAPLSINAKLIRDFGHSQIPQYGWIPVTVPGAPAAWSALSKRFGRLSFPALLEPAINYAQHGYPVSVNVAKQWGRAFSLYQNGLDRNMFQHWLQLFSIEGRCPQAGDIWRSTDMANTLSQLADTCCKSFYRGTLAHKISAYAQDTGGYLQKEDLAAFAPRWVEPIRTSYRGYDVWEIPPNGHGICVLMALNILKGFSLSANREEAENYHLQIEAMKLAFADTKQFVADPDHMSVPAASLLSDAYAEQRRLLIGSQALTPMPGKPPSGGTVYLCTADREGNMVSYIQSNYTGFGSGVVIPGTGISLQNRGYGFALEEGCDNVIAGGKYPYHTIIPGFLSKAGDPIGPFGVMGAFMQPQGHLQVVCNLVDFHLNPQDCLDAPRWQWMGGNQIEVEQDVPQHIVSQLAQRGHDITVQHDSIDMGRGQMILRMENGAFCGGTEPRADGTIAAY